MGGTVRCTGEGGTRGEGSEGDEGGGGHGGVAGRRAERVGGIGEELVRGGAFEAGERLEIYARDRQM